MNIYIAGISGTGMGPLALMAKKAGIKVYGSDRSTGAIAPELEKAGIEYHVGEQDGSYLTEKIETVGIDWFIYTSALPATHPELVLAKEKGIKTSKRDELIAKLVKDLHLNMVAVAGTHGKTTTTSMLIWAMQKLTDEEGRSLIPSAYLVGTTLRFTTSGSYKEGDEFFLYEADEYDRNFLHFYPWLSLITYVSFDHPDIYASEEDYKKAFEQFELQSDNVLFGTKDAAPEDLRFLTDKGKSAEIISAADPRLTIAGKARREDATSAFYAIRKMLDVRNVSVSDEAIIKVLNEFPGVGRRFECIADGVYTDYAHHPEEVKATVEIAREEADKTGKKGVVVVYEPHQNTRQHEVRGQYKDAFDHADRLFWLPTFLTREDPSLAVLAPADFIKDLNSSEKAIPAECNAALSKELHQLQKEGYLVILMTAGPADLWLRKEFAVK